MTDPIPCPQCAATIPAGVLSCPMCRALVHARELESLAAQARDAAARGETATAVGHWRAVLNLLPQDTVQYESVSAKIAGLESTPAPPLADSNKGKVFKGLAALGPLVLLVLSKGKLLLLGLTKMSTLLSMVAFLGFYWTQYGWAFALGSVLSIYVHEMGHVIVLRQYGIAAGAPMFIPGFGAFIRLRQLHISPVQDSRVGLAGPIYGLGAALFALLVAYAMGSKSWAAIAHFGATINLFNLIPIWQLDGARGWRSLTRQQRYVVLGLTAVLWLLTSEPMLMLIAIGAGYRLFLKDHANEPDSTGLMYYGILLGALAGVSMLAQRLAR
ncbi:MAG: site-2 protease family protein [Bryobacteraceae bacterium]